MPDPENKGEGSAGFVPPADGSWVPRERLNEKDAEIRTLSERLATLDGRMTELSRSQTQERARQPEPVKTYSREQLRAAVAGGQITQDRMEDIWAEQTARQTTEAARTAAMEVVTATTGANRLDTEFLKYKAAKPDAFVENGNADRRKVKDEFDFLVAHGSPATRETELAAMRAAFGPAEKLGSMREREPTHESHQEIMSGSSNRGGDQGTDEDSPSRPPKGLTKDEHAYYADAIAKHVYADWNGVRKVMKHSNTGLRQRMGARLGMN